MRSCGLGPLLASCRGSGGGFGEVAVTGCGNRLSQASSRGERASRGSLAVRPWARGLEGVGGKVSSRVEVMQRCSFTGA